MPRESELGINKPNLASSEVNCVDERVILGYDFFSNVESFDKDIYLQMLGCWESWGDEATDLNTVKTQLKNWVELKFIDFSSDSRIDEQIDEQSDVYEYENEDENEDENESDDDVHSKTLNDNYKVDNLESFNEPDEDGDQIMTQSNDEEGSIDKTIDSDIDNTHMIDDTEENTAISDTNDSVEIRENTNAKPYIVNNAREYSKLEKSVIFIYAIESYFDNSESCRPMVDILNYFSYLSCQILDGLTDSFGDTQYGFSIILDNHILKKRLYFVLQKLFTYPSKSQSDAFLLFYSKYVGIQKTNVQNFLQILLFKSLFKRRELVLVYEQITKYNLHKPNEVDSFALERKDLIIHYYIMAKSCIATENYVLAYHLFQIMVHLGEQDKNASIKEEIMCFMLSEYVAVLMKLNKTWHDKDNIFFKYTTLLELDLVECYKYFSMGDYPSFLRSYLNYSLKRLPIDPHVNVPIKDSNMITTQKTIFTEALLKQLSINLLTRRFSLLNNVVKDDRILDKLINTNEIMKSNSILNKLNVNIRLQELKKFETDETVTAKDLISKSLTTAKLNGSLRERLTHIELLKKYNDL